MSYVSDGQREVDGGMEDVLGAIDTLNNPLLTTDNAPNDANFHI